jgi:nitroimidazol reductase NimA-like FMN-containing flavoprotein (pyridoxamine 5'-phosphate oxidase superfamily)
MIPERALMLLTQKRIGYLCTAGVNNQPHITPIFSIYDPESNNIYFQTKKRTKKVRDIMANPRVSITVDIRDPLNPFNNEGVMVQGKAEILEVDFEDALPREMGMAIGIIKEKFVDVVTKGSPGDKVVVRINIQKMVHWRGPRFQSVEI